LLLLFSPTSIAKEENIKDFWWQTPNLTIQRLEQEQKKVVIANNLTNTLRLSYIYQQVGRDHDAQKLFKKIKKSQIKSPLQQFYNLKIEAGFALTKAEELSFLLKAVSIAEAENLHYQQSITSIAIANNYLYL